MAPPELVQLAETWLDTAGATVAARWREWLAAHRAQLSWDAETRSIVVK